MTEPCGILESADKAFKTTFWKELEGLELVHKELGRGRISSVDGTCVHVAHNDYERTYSAPVLHSYITELSEIPDNSIAAAPIFFEREIAGLSAKWAKFQIDWRGLWQHAGIIKDALRGWESRSAFSPDHVKFARSIGIGHIVPLGYEMIAAVDPWNYVKASAEWRKLGLPEESVRCIKERLGPALRERGRQSDLERAGLTSLIAALVDVGHLDVARPYARTLAKLPPNDKSCLALFRYFREVGDEPQRDLWLEKAREFGVEPSPDPKPHVRRDWIARWRRKTDARLSSG